MKTDRLIFLLLSCVVLFACNNAHLQYGEKINIENTRTVNHAVINDDFIFTPMPTDLFVVDSLIIVADFYQKDKAFHVFNKESGKWIKSFGHKGQGPGELLFPISAWMDKNNNIVAYSSNRQRIVSYNFAAEKIDFQERKINNPENFFIADVQSSGNTIFARGIDVAMRFGTVANNELKALDIRFPKLLDGSDEIDRAIANYMPSWRISPDETKLAVATYIGGVIEIININRNDSDKDKIMSFFKPKCRIVEGAVPLNVSWTDETTFGVQDMYVSDKYIYVLVNGGKAKDESFFPNTIAVFDWNGNGICEYKLDIGINKFTVDEPNKCIYAISFSRDMEFNMVKFIY